MSHWGFVIAAYAITIIGTLGVTLWSFAAMKRAETAAADIRRDER